MYREFFLFGRRFFSIPSDQPYVLVRDTGADEHLDVTTNTDDVQHDEMLYAALYNPESV